VNLVFTGTTIALAAAVKRRAVGSAGAGDGGRVPGLAAVEGHLRRRGGDPGRRRELQMAHGDPDGLAARRHRPVQAEPGDPVAQRHHRLGDAVPALQVRRRAA
jgi:hypothetical protein